MELGQTQSAMALIPGSVSNARSGATEWARTAGKALATRDAFAKLDDAGTWTGAAYDRYLERFHTQLAYWQDTSDVFTSAANALGNYANALEWAQAEAARAIELWDAAEAQAAAALVQHEEYVRELRRGHGLRHVDVDVPFVDPSGPAHQEARAVLANARYQLDVLATGYANTIGEASNAAPLPLTPQQAQQAAIDAAVYLTVDMSVVQPFVSTLNFLGGIVETVLEHPDIVFEILGGILGIAGGVATIVGGGGLELVTVGGASPIAVPAVIAGGTVAAGGAGMLGNGIDRWMNESRPRSRPPTGHGPRRRTGLQRQFHIPRPGRAP
ncbi:putative T7SS-secreted protein, partial [Microbacterium sp. GXS0129]|uniref:putative T7SS-secreted protein n=1 Tax=Microbacterium sp. GXS0129 TaxID=3377836 RepID=UPI00383AB979